jgi:Flp pilus assembly pilin Flp
MKEERGQDLTEYALWTGVIALALMGAVAFFLLENPVQGLAAGIGRCIDFDSGSSCNPF